MSQYRRCSDCSHCALDGKRIVYGQMPEAATNGIVLLGEAPGAAEEAEGVPFTGPSGRLLNWALKCSGIDRHKCWVTNSILCRPPTNDIGGFEGESAKKACSSGLAQELRAAKQAGIRVIVALGETAFRALNISGSPSSLRGSVLDGTGAAEGMFVIPTYHPAYLYRNNWTRVAGGSASHTAVWLSDLEKAREVARPGWKRPAERFITHPTIQDLEALWQRVQCEPDLVLGVDIETTSLDPRYGEIVVIGFSTSEEDAICVPLLKAGAVGSDGRRHGIPYWPNGSATKARYYLEKILTTAKQMYQNGFFDIPYLRYHGFSVPDSLYTYDSMLLHAIVSPETEHNLGFITSVYGKTPYWKDEFKNRAGGIFDMDETRMRAYNCRDCVTLQQIVPAMLRHMSDLNLLRVWDEEVHPMVRPIMIMKEKGVLFNKSRMASFQEKMTKRLQEKALELRALGSLPEAFNISSDDEVRLFLFGVRPSKAVQLTSWVFTGQEPCKPTKAEPDRTHRPGEKIITGIIDDKAARRELPEGFIVESSRKVPTLEIKKKGTNLYEDLLTLDTILRETTPLYIVPGYNGPKTDGGKFATNKDGLLSLRIAAQNRLDYLDALKTPREDEVTRCTDLLVWLEAFADYSAAEKLITAFTRYRTSSDGRIHPNWQIHGTSTGRLSCTDPNLMQLPSGKVRKEDKEIRRFFYAPEGWSMVSSDFSSAEVGLLAFELDDEAMIKDYEAGISPHAANVKILFGFDKSHPLFEEAKLGAKKFQFGGLSYGGGDRFVFRQITKECTHIKLSFADYQKGKAAWMALHPKYEAWRSALEAEVLEKRIIYNEFGRARIFLDNDKDIVKEAMNFKIQSAGASILNRVIARIQARIDAHVPALKGYPIMQIHDQLVYECPDDEVEVFKTFITEEMTRPFMYKGHPRSLRIELSTGKTFGDLD
jgi:uracil-DNA glycosylase family 4